jgi:hypothetical protein
MERALIVQKKWLDKIFDEGKVWEMRSTKTKVRGTVGLIESGSGLIVGSVEIVDCSNFPINKLPHYKRLHLVEDESLLDKWCYAWVLDNAKRFDKPIPYKHPKGAVIWVKI